MARCKCVAILIKALPHSLSKIVFWLGPCNFKISIFPFYLQVSERIEDNLEKLRMSSSIWEDVYHINEEIDSWSNSCVMELTDSLNRFSDSQKAENRLAEVKACVSMETFSAYIIS